MMAKTIVRSTAAKLAAFLLILYCAAQTLATVEFTLLDLKEKYDRGGWGLVYQLDSSFRNSDWVNSQMGNMAWALENALHGGMDQPEFDQIDDAKRFVGDYYAHVGDRVLKNAELTPEEAENSYIYLYATQNDGSMYNFRYYYSQPFHSSLWENDGAADDGGEPAAAPGLPEDAVIILRITAEQAAPYEAEWAEQRDTVLGMVKHAMWYIVIALAAYLYLLFVTGRRGGDEDVHLITIDRLFVECNLLLLCGALLGAGAANVVVMLELMSGAGNDLRIFVEPTIVLFVAALALAVELSLSLVRNLKNRTFVRRSLFLRACGWCWRMAVRLLGWLCGGLRECRNVLLRGRGAIIRTRNGLWSKLLGGCQALLKNYKTRNVLLLFAGFSAVLALLAFLTGVLLFESAASLLFLLLAVAWFAAAAMFLLRRVQGFDRIVDGLKRLRAGEVDCKLTDMPIGVFAGMAEDINSLGDGMQAALQNAIRAERMKTELITNVSHDLKTPLTSILNYADLLCQQQLTPEEANDYAAIIRQKGLRLKNLTSDLFDISKVQSGAETIECERLDACTLVRQALAEQDAAIKAGGLTFKVDLPTGEVPIWADGKKMSRVMENLIGNCIKYALAGTRVFLSVSVQEGNRVRIELKNIANYAMDFDPGEITERFVRGDAARSTEGSGLGLAIAKSYVTACGGTLSVEVDGDLFKVRIEFALHGK